MSEPHMMNMRDDPEVPHYVLDHTPLLHLYSKDPYRPSFLAAHLRHTSPLDDKFQKIPMPDPPLTLADIDRLNTIANGEAVYLTSNDDVTTNPQWLTGESEDGGEKTSVVIVVPREAGTVDVFYFYFFSFNWGGVVLTKELGAHVGDWEHAMIRFIDGTPRYVWLSQHANGEAYTFECLEKDSSGRRPLLYCANGSHALYPTPGQHDHTIPNFNLPIGFILVDETDAGPLYDSLPASYYYSYNPSNTTFTAYNPSDPVGYLNFTGRWGDKEYPADDDRQKGKNLLGFKKYVGGPTGPADKQLVRKEVWPDNQYKRGQRIRKRLPGTKTWFGKVATWLA